MKQIGAYSTNFAIKNHQTVQNLYYRSVDGHNFTGARLLRYFASDFH